MDLMPDSLIFAGVSKSGSPDPEPDDVFALGLELVGLGGDGQRRRRLEVDDAVGQFSFHLILTSSD